MKAARRAGFTLIELLIVLVIIAILTALVAPQVTSVLRANALTQASINLVNLFGFARQAAIAQNQVMEVRLYQFAEPTFPGEISGNAASGKYRAAQVYELTDTGTSLPWIPFQRLPASIIIDSGTALSSLVNATQVKVWTANDPQLPLPGGIGINYNCRAFRFRTDGATDLSSTPPSPPGTWCLTLHSLVLGDALAQPPTNFVTMQVDPTVGKVVTFRP